MVPLFAFLPNPLPWWEGSSWACCVLGACSVCDRTVDFALTRPLCGRSHCPSLWRLGEPWAACPWHSAGKRRGLLACVKWEPALVQPCWVVCPKAIAVEFKVQAAWGPPGAQGLHLPQALFPVPWQLASHRLERPRHPPLRHWKHLLPQSQETGLR